MWPFKKKVNGVVVSSVVKNQRLQNDVLDKLLSLIATSHVEVDLNTRGGSRCVVGGVVEISDYEGHMRVKVGDSSVFIRRSSDLDFDMICDALNSRLLGLRKELTPHTVLSYDAFNDAIMQL